MVTRRMSGTAARAAALCSGGVRGERVTAGMPSSSAIRSAWPVPPACLGGSGYTRTCGHMRWMSTTR